MVIFIRLKERQDQAPDDRDSLERTWFGYDPAESDGSLWANNRGRYTFSVPRMSRERYVALVFEGRVVLVAEKTGHELTDHPQAQTKDKYALTGAPLAAGHPVYDALIGSPRPRGRYTIWYEPDPDAAPSEARATVLLSWNPRVWDWGSGYPDTVDRTSVGEQVADEWTTGSRRSGLQHGDRAFLLRQGVEPRGIAGAGWIAGPIAMRDSNDPNVRSGPAVRVVWETVLHEEDFLPLGALQSGVPSQEWEPQGSGTLVRSENTAALETLWAAHVTSLVSGADLGGGGGQGRVVDPIIRKKIEDAAQDRLMKLYRDDNWVVEDTRYGNPYDAKATKDGRVVYLEAKGTQLSGVSVTLTRNEVDHARAHPGSCFAGVWSGIKFLDDGEVDPEAGTFRHLPLNPDDGALEIVDYRWSLPVDHA